VTEAEAEKILREASLRVTRPRIAVLTEIHEAPHRDAAAIIGTVRERLGSVSTQAVYGVLNTLVEAGLARRIDLPGSAALYERRRGDDHPHAVCRSCGAITDLDGQDPGVPAEPVGGSGFRVERIELTYWGVCTECQLPGGAESNAAA